MTVAKVKRHKSILSYSSNALKQANEPLLNKRSVHYSEWPKLIKYYLAKNVFLVRLGLSKIRNLSIS